MFCRQLSFGGGPGFDALGLAALRRFVGSSAPLHAAILDYEMGWAPAVQALQVRTAVTHGIFVEHSPEAIRAILMGSDRPQSEAIRATLTGEGGGGGGGMAVLHAGAEVAACRSSA